MKPNRYGETLEQCTARLKKEKVTSEIAGRYAMDIARTFENLHDDHNANFYREVASRLSASHASQDTAATA